MTDAAASPAQGAKKQDVKRLPEGVQMTLSVFVTNDESGLEMCVNLEGMTSIPQSIVDPLHVDDLVAEVSKLGADLSNPGWRPMTRAEIKDYQDREKSDGSENDDGFDD